LPLKLANLKLIVGTEKRVDIIRKVDKVKKNWKKNKERDREIVERMHAERALVKVRKYGHSSRILISAYTKAPLDIANDLSRLTLPCLKYS
jgi:hypothetical protein